MSPANFVLPPRLRDSALSKPRVLPRRRPSECEARRFIYRVRFQLSAFSPLVVRMNSDLRLPLKRVAPISSASPRLRVDKTVDAYSQPRERMRGDAWHAAA